MKTNLLYISLFLMAFMMSCNQESKELQVEVFETSINGNKLEKIIDFSVNKENDVVNIEIYPDNTFQTITGFGGSFTESSAYLLNKLSKENRNKILEAYFGENGAKYSLTRTHISSCDFSLNNYTYAPVEGDIDLVNFSIDEDRDDLIPMIKDAMEISKQGFNIIASPWTAPPWMKDNKKYVGGKLLPEYNDSYALFFSKYLDAYKEEGLDIWGVT
jgi:glucosylceramidase